MKIFVNRIVILLVVLVSFSCSKDEQNEDELLVGTWQMLRKTVDGTTDQSDAVTKTFMEISSNGILRYYKGESGVTTRSGWSYKDNMLNIAIFMPAGFYIDEMDQNALSLRKMDLQNDKIIVSQFQWKRVDKSAFPEK